MVTATLELPEDLWGCGEMVIGMLSCGEYTDESALFTAVKELVEEDIRTFHNGKRFSVIQDDIFGPAHFIDTQQEANECCKAALEYNVQSSPDLIDWLPANPHGLFMHDDPWELVKQLLNRLRIAEDKIAETDAVARGYVTTEEMAIMLAMISSLTYEDALSGMKESLEALANSKGACQELFDVRAARLCFDNRGRGI